MVEPYMTTHAVLPISSLGEEIVIYAPADRFIEDFNGDISRLYPSMALRFQIESKDLEKGTVTMSIHGNLVSPSLKTVKVTITVTPKEEMSSSRVEWTVGFEKNSHHEDGYYPLISGNGRVFAALVDHIKFTGAYLHQLSLNAEVPADEYFKAFIEAFENDADVEIEAKDGENKTSTMSLRSTHSLMEGYKTFKVTTTITPLKDNKGSHMRWTIEADKISNHCKLEDTAKSIRSMIRDKLSHLRIY